ncbi:MAG: hypothetical protein EBV65_01350 [Gammaproteobacteria bacterium]|nr:hypothetical protein [Gammaproteobacteria bacterium]NBP06882.1 hypothetical protein [Gammaproteobacteria bacterium]NCW20381.1 hypothetical protein [Gammaproteobacteria bacterium]NCW56307.1 hypothetical protein [Gammaproteobacteria bacterium]NDA42267.1 hypothetical protein [Gammaproteobacteria bacterium]
MIPRNTSWRLGAALLAATCALALAACGQTGALYLPEDSGQVIIRERGAPATSTETPPAPASTPAPKS